MAQTLSQNLSGPSKHNASSITGASSTGFSFYWGGPLQRLDPLSFHIRVPAPVIWLTSTEAPFHWQCFSLCCSSLIYLYFSVTPFLPLVAPSLFSLLMRSEFVLKNYDVILRSKRQIKDTFGSSPNAKQERICRVLNLWSVHGVT